MTIPWDDDATASINGGDGREIICEGPLRAIVSLLAQRSLEELNSVLIRFPERRSPPYGYDGTDVHGLSLALSRKKRAAFAKDGAANRRLALNPL